MQDTQICILSEMKAGRANKTPPGQAATFEKWSWDSEEASAITKQLWWSSVYGLFSSPVGEPLDWIRPQDMGAAPQGPVPGSVSEGRDKLTLW